MAILALLFFVYWLSEHLLSPSEQVERVFLLKGDKPGEPNTYVTKRRPKKIILMIGDGMGLTQITAGMIAKRSSLALERIRHIGLVKTFSTKLITDSAAGATAMATGQKTYNGAIAVDVNQSPLQSITELAKLQGSWAAALLTTVTVTHATPAAFYGHEKERRRVNRNLAETFMNTGIEILMGGGLAYFQPGEESPRDLLKEAQEKGYLVATDVEKITGAPPKMLCLFTHEMPGRLSKRGNFLPLATQKALESLDAHYPRFFMMVEGAQIDLGGHARNSDYIIEEMLDFDRSIEKALNYAEQDGETLVIITADHETGGYSITGGDLKKGEVEGKFTTDYHTATMVPIFAFGPGAESFTGVMDNTEIFYKLRYLMDLR